jgi:hypothetical protein
MASDGLPHQVLEGSISAPEILSADGPVRLSRYAALQSDVSELAGSEAASIYAETYGGVLERSIESAEDLKRALDNPIAALSTTFGSDVVSRQLQQVAMTSDDLSGPLRTSEDL